MKKTTEQNSRLFYQKRDHKDVFAKDPITHEPTFYGAMVMANIDEDGRLLLWRKMFKDRYIVCRLNGGGHAGSWGVCYPIERTLEYGGYVGTAVKCDEDIMLYQIAQTENVFLTSKDNKLIKMSTIENAYASFIPFFNGIIVPARNSSQQACFLTFKDNELVGHNREIDSIEEIGSYSEFEIVSPNTVPANGSGRCAIMRRYDADYSVGDIDKIAYMVWDAESKQFYTHWIESEIVEKKRNVEYNVLDRPLGANGRNFVFFRTYDLKEENGKEVIDSYYFTIYEYTPTSMVKLGYTPKTSTMYATGSIALKYCEEDNLFYIYHTYYEAQNHITNRILTTPDMKDFEAYKQEDVVYLKDINGENEIELIFNGPYSGRNAINCYSLNAYENVIHENNEIVKNTSDVSWTNNDVTYYFDNLMMAPSEGNFYFFANQMYEAGTQQMFRKYYYTEEKEDDETWDDSNIEDSD